MKPRSCFLSVAAYLVSTALAKSCTDYKIPVTITSDNLVYALPPFDNNFDVSAFVDTLTSRAAPPASSLFSGSVNQTASYTIGATFCKPGHGKPDSHGGTVLIATHGLNFDRGYWDPAFKPDLYSFVDFVVDLGYSILFYDRLGVGESSQISGYVAQLANEAAVLDQIAHYVKAGKYTADVSADHIVLVGHSFGSAIIVEVAAIDPTIADALIITGFSFNTTAVNVGGFFSASALRIAAAESPAKWRQLDTGYLTAADIYGSVVAFFHQGDYEVGIAEYADAHKQPLALTEFLTAGSPSPPTSYTGATMLITGQFDFIFCTSDCDGGVLEVPTTEIFSNAKALSIISYPGAGHGLNLHLNATGAFKDITDFLAVNDL